LAKSCTIIVAARALAAMRFARSLAASPTNSAEEAITSTALVTTASLVSSESRRLFKSRDLDVPDCVNFYTIAVDDELQSHVPFGPNACEP
jgi:hypothetical protein